MEATRSIDELYADPVDALLDRRTRSVARTFLRRLSPKHEPLRALVYGSRARGEHESESDLDLAVIMAGPPGDRWALAREMARLAFDVLMETDVLVDPLPLWEVELTRIDLFHNTALMRAILREGVSP